MEKLSAKSFVDCVELQVDFLNAGRPLASFDAFFEEAGVMFADDIIFATGRTATNEYGTSSPCRFTIPAERDLAKFSPTILGRL